MLLLLLGYCLRRWQRKTSKGIARNVAGDPETDAFEQGAAHSSGTVDVEPWPNEFLTDSRPNMRDEVVDSPPERMTRPSFKQDRVRRTVAAAKEAAGSDGPQPAFAAPGTPRQAAQIATSTTPATGYGAAAPASRSGGESSQAGSSANEWFAKVQHCPTSRMSSGKLTDAAEAAPMDKAARFRERKASITAGDDMFEDAKGTREGPGRCVSSRCPSSSSHPGGGQAVDTEMRLVCSTRSSSASPHGPNPPARKPDDIWAAVRARRAESAAAAAAASPHSDQGRHKARALLSQERISVHV